MGPSSVLLKFPDLILVGGQAVEVYRTKYELSDPVISFDVDYLTSKRMAQKSCEALNLPYKDAPRKGGMLGLVFGTSEFETHQLSFWVVYVE